MGRRSLHRLAFSPSNFAKSLIKPIDLHAIMAIMQTTDCGRLAVQPERKGHDTYLKRKKEEVHIPVYAGHAVFINDRHANGSQTICQDR
jgi:hypothetical protein